MWRALGFTLILGCATRPGSELRDAVEKDKQSIDYDAQAGLGRYTPPDRLPAIAREDPAAYLKYHRLAWEYEVSRPTLDDFNAETLTGVESTVCFKPPLESAARWAGQRDGTEFVLALHRRSKRDPAAVDDFRKLRDSILAAHPWHRPAQR